MTREQEKLKEDRERKAYWRRWGPYLSERQWGTVREDYSVDGEAWDYFPHDHARSRAYRWGEDGLGGISDNHQRLCFAISLWNTKDPIIKERLYGLSGSQGNHGEDVKEYYYYLDNTPIHSYMKYLYKYTQSEFPYARLVRENKQRDRITAEFELIDTGIFHEDRYFDVFIEYAKNTPEDILIKITIINRGSDPHVLHLLPTLWFRNIWSWADVSERPVLKQVIANERITIIEARHPSLGTRWLYCEGPKQLLFTENETNHEQLFGVRNPSPYVKDGINEYIVHGNEAAVNPAKTGTKVSAHYKFNLTPGDLVTVRLRLSDSGKLSEPFGSEFEKIIEAQIQEADEFYAHLIPDSLTEDMKNIQRQAFAGMLWTKQFYHYVIETWLQGDQKGPLPSLERYQGRNHDWDHLYAEDILSMPDKWEFPFFAAWDTAFHLIPL